MTQQVAWNTVSNQKRTLIHRRALAAKEILLKALLFFRGCFPGAGTDGVCFSANCLCDSEVPRKGRAEDPDVG